MGNFTTTLRNQIESAAVNNGVKIQYVTPATVGPVVVFDPNAATNLNGRPNGAVDSNPGPNVLPDSYVVELQAGATASVIDGNNTTDIVALNDGFQFVNGRANKLVLQGNNDVVNDTLQNGVVAVSGTGEGTTLQGAYNILNIDAGTTGTFSTNLATSISVGDKAAIYGNTPPPATAVNLQVGVNSTVDLNTSAGSEIITLNGDGDTINATAGSDTLFSGNYGTTFTAQRANFEFISGNNAGGGVPTLTGGSGNGVVFAGNGVNYTESLGNNVFVGGVTSLIANAGETLSYGTTSPTKVTLQPHNSTVIGTTGHDTLYGGTVGDDYQIGSASELYVGGGGVDTITGGTVAPTLFGGSNTTQHLVNTASGGTFVAVGNNGVIDGSQAGAGSTYWALDVGVGNTTLVGSTAITSPQQHDSFAVASVAGAMSAHTVTINDFQSGDAVYLVGYGQADQNTFAQAVDASFSSGSALSFTLSDQTTVTFIGSHPTGAFDGGRDAL